MLQLLLAHGFTSFGDRLWQFSVPAFLAVERPEAPYLASALAAISQLSCFAVSPLLGSLVDWNPLVSILAAVVVQNVSVVAICFLFLRGSTESPLWLIAAISSVASATSLICSVVMERMWIPAVAHDQRHLLQVNGYMRRINLACEVGAPMVFGVLMSWLGSEPALLMAVGWNVLSCFVECTLYWLGSQRVTEEARRKQRSKAQQQKARKPKISFLHAWRSFWNHGLFWQSLSFILLFFNMMTPGVIMTTFLVHNRIELWAIGVFRAACAIFGIIGSKVALFLTQQHGIARAATISNVFQTASVAAALVVLLQGTTVSPYWYMFWIALSRIGLWSYDLLHAEICQLKLLGDEERAVVSSVEYGLCELGMLFTNLGGIFIVPPHMSPLGLLSMGILFVASGCHWQWTKTQRMDQNSGKKKKSN